MSSTGTRVERVSRSGPIADFVFECIPNCGIIFCALWDDALRTPTTYTHLAFRSVHSGIPVYTLLLGCTQPTKNVHSRQKMYTAKFPSEPMYTSKSGCSPIVRSRQMCIISVGESDRFLWWRGTSRGCRRAKYIEFARCFLADLLSGGIWWVSAQKVERTRCTFRPPLAEPSAIQRVRWALCRLL